MKCDLKKKFNTQDEANKIIEVSKNKFNQKQYSYICPKCGFYHLTTNSPQKEIHMAKVRQSHRISKEADYWESKFEKI